MIKLFYRLVHVQARELAKQKIDAAPDGWLVNITEPKRTSGQNEKFHAICGDIAKSGLTWAGKPRDAAAWKVLLVSGHATATKEGAEMVPGIEGEFVNLRESTALMSVKRGSSLIEYAVAFAVSNGIQLHEMEPWEL
jgi:hypothetical protein